MQIRKRRCKKCCEQKDVGYYTVEKDTWKRAVARSVVFAHFTSYKNDLSRRCTGFYCSRKMREKGRDAKELGNDVLYTLSFLVVEGIKLLASHGHAKSPLSFSTLCGSDESIQWTFLDHETWLLWPYPSGTFPDALLKLWLDHTHGPEFASSIIPLSLGFIVLGESK